MLIVIFLLLLMLLGVISYLFLYKQRVRVIVGQLLPLTDGLDILSAPLTKHKDDLENLARLISLLARNTTLKTRLIVHEKDRLETVLLNLLDGVLLTDAKGRLTYINDRLLEWIGIDYPYFEKRPLEVLRNLDIDTLIDQVCGGIVNTIETIFSEPQSRFLEIHGAPLYNEGNIIGAVLIFHDVTAFKQVENLRKDFIANVSHELRTPISNIQGCAETLLDGALHDQQEARQFINIIHDEAIRTGRMVSDLLELAKAESGTITVEKTFCNFKLIVSGVVSSLGKKISDKQISLQLNLLSSIPLVYSDENMLVQILHNLLDNAIKYTSPMGQITLSAKVDGNSLLVSIKDTGEGIAEAEKPRIFERFYRVDKAHSRSQGGTGLGLAIVKHLVQILGGQIMVESTLGKGSDFNFSLPLQSDNQPL